MSAGVDRTARGDAGRLGYRLVRLLTRALLGIFYREIRVLDPSRIPADGGLIVAANHHNSLIDPMLVTAAFPRPITVLANAPLFRHPLIGPFLWLVGGVPVHRRLESGDDPAKNVAMFATAIAALRRGGAILIFPEGRTQPRPTLLPLRTGAARILLGAESAAEGPAGVVLLPVGLVFREPGTFRAAVAWVVVGPPVPTADCVATHRASPEAAARALTERLTHALRAQITEAEDLHTLDLVAVLEQAWRDEARDAGDGDPRSALAWRQQVTRAARYLAEREPALVADLRRRVERYRIHLEEAGLTGEELDRRLTPGVVLRGALWNLIGLVLSLPLALWGVLSHAIPYTLTGAVVRRLRRTAEEEATDKIAAGLLLYPLCWLAEGWLVRAVGNRLGLLLFLALLVPSGLFALSWGERLARVERQARALSQLVGDPFQRRRLRLERRKLVDELTALAAMVPDAVRVGADDHAG
jgi:glycerol-3-phosphate O-acyltransferase / dihydroxyacetone phosphate acyltransferase